MSGHYLEFQKVSKAFGDNSVLEGASSSIAAKRLSSWAAAAWANPFH